MPKWLSVEELKQSVRCGDTIEFRLKGIAILKTKYYARCVPIGYRDDGQSSSASSTCALVEIARPDVEKVKLRKRVDFDELLDGCVGRIHTSPSRDIELANCPSAERKPSLWSMIVSFARSCLRVVKRGVSRVERGLITHLSPSPDDHQLGKPISVWRRARNLATHIAIYAIDTIAAIFLTLSALVLAFLILYWLTLSIAFIYATISGVSIGAMPYLSTLVA